MSKKSYRVHNWENYNRSLINRGNIMVWVSKDIHSHWHYGKARRPGGVYKYSDLLIMTALVIKEVYHLPFRACEGMLRSLVSMLKLAVEVPSYTTLCRRASGLEIDLAVGGRHKTKIAAVLIDSTGIRIYGQSQWSAAKGYQCARQAWTKLSIAVDAQTHEILGLAVSDGHAYDANFLPPLLAQLKPSVEKVKADGAYDKRKCYIAAAKKGAYLVTPPQHRACVQTQNRNTANHAALNVRDEAIAMIKTYETEEQGRKAWKIGSGYHQRSLVETAMFRLKSIFGEDVRCRKPDNQAMQLRLRCYALNKMSALGLPQSVEVTG